MQSINEVKLAFSWVIAGERGEKCLKKDCWQKTHYFSVGYHYFDFFYYNRLFKSFSSWKRPNLNVKPKTYRLTPSPCRPQCPPDSTSSSISLQTTSRVLSATKPATKKRWQSDHPAAKPVKLPKIKNNPTFNQLKS
jgi:hypothetical protein